MSSEPVVGFDMARRRWVDATSRADSVRPLPELDGKLLVDPSALLPYARDFGNADQRAPSAVLLPAHDRDVQRVVRFARDCRIPVAARGQGHTTFGQCLVNDGLVVDMRALDTIHSIDASSADVDAGVTWRTLVKQTVPLGLRPPVLTGYLELSVGGTLSVGGVSSSYASGAQVDNVRELRVVTGTGESMRCSERRNADLFEAALAGLGQCGIITRAVVDLVAAPAMARTFTLRYESHAAFFADFRAVLRRGEFDNVVCLWTHARGAFRPELIATKLFEPGERPDDALLLANLTQHPAAAETIEARYLEHILRDDIAIDAFEARGLFRDVVHPWFDVWLPDSTVERYTTDVVSELTPEDVGETGFLLLIPQRRSALRRKSLIVPDDEWVYLFDVLTANAAAGPDPAFHSRMLERNQRLYQRALDVGATRYPIGTLRFSRDDWAEHYGARHEELTRLKRKYDPANILTPGPGVFG